MAFTTLSALNIMFDLTFTDKNKIENKDSTEGWQRRIAEFFALPSLTIFFPLELIAMPFKLARNLLKLPLVFLVFLGCNLFLQPVFNRRYKELLAENLSIGEKIKSGLVVFGLGILLGILYGVGYISQLILSPIDTVTGLWNMGRRTNSKLHMALAIAAGVAVALFYMVLAPIAIYVLGPLLLAKLSTILPVVLTHAIQSIISAMAIVSNAIAPVCQLIGAYTFNCMLGALGLTPAQVGFGELIGLLTFGIGSVIAVVSDKVSEWYHSREIKPPVVVVEEVDDDYSSDSESTRMIDNALLSAEESQNSKQCELDPEPEPEINIKTIEDKKPQNNPSNVKSKIRMWNSNQDHLHTLQKQDRQFKY